MTISVFELSKFYNSHPALRSISFSADTGITGLLGPNGAGKTTLLNILVTLVDPSSGQATVGGYDIRSQRSEIRQLIGYLPQEFGLYDGLTVYEFLDYMCVLKGILERHRCVLQAVEDVGLGGDVRQRVGTLSGGMRQRLGIAQALLNTPPVLILDEPTVGLDPAERNRFRQLLAKLSGRSTVLLSTHLVEDITLAASRVVVLNKGFICFDGSVDELVISAQDKVWSVAVPYTHLEDVQHRFSITNIATEGGICIVRFLSDEPPNFANAVLVSPNIEDAYLRLVQVRHD